MTVRVIDDTRYVLGEGPCWVASTSTLSWIDIEDGLIMSAIYRDGTLGTVTTLEVGGVIGCALPLDGGRFLVGLESWIGIVHPDGRIEKSRALIAPNCRLNDGKIDPQGRLVVGSLRRVGPSETQVLLRLEHDGTVTTLDDDIRLSNGLAWSPDGSVLYTADSGIDTIYARPYADGTAGHRAVFAHLDGMPDGLTVDSDGNLWITIFSASRVDCYGPDGVRIPARTIDLPQHHPASVEFAGADLGDLVVATGFPRLDDPELAALRTERDGQTLVVRPGAIGVPATRWREAPLPQRRD